MDDQLQIRKGDPLADLLEHVKNCRKASMMAAAVCVEMEPLDAFHDEIEQAVGRDAAVVEADDVGVLELGEGAQFASVTLVLAGSRETPVESFEGDLLFVDSVLASGE